MIIRRWYVVFLAVALGACVEGSSTIPQQEMDPSQLAGKADGVLYVTVQEADESLWSEHRKLDVCKAIEEGHLWSQVSERETFKQGCLSHTFTVYEKVNSTYYFNASGDPLLMEMKVRVNDTWSCRLYRELQPGYQLAWMTELLGVKLSEDDRFILQVAEALNGYGPYPDSVEGWESYVEETNSVPAAMEQIFQEQLVVDKAEEQDKQQQGEDAAFPVFIYSTHKILKEVELGDYQEVGYLLGIWRGEDESTWGTHYFYNLDGDLLKKQLFSY